MSVVRWKRVILGAGAILSLVWGLEASAQLPELVIQIADVEALPGDEGVRIPVYCDNFSQGIAGFEIEIGVANPELISLGTAAWTVVDTSYWICDGYDGMGRCIDSLLIEEPLQADFVHIDTISFHPTLIDTVGTLVSGWEVVDSRVLNSNGMFVRVIGLADNFGGLSVPPINPQIGGVLFYLVVDAAPLDNSVMNRVVEFDPLVSPNSFCFSSPEGQCIGLDKEAIYDTTCYQCTAWLENICLNWIVSSEPPCDSISVSLDSVNYYPPQIVVGASGSISIGFCGASADLVTPVGLSRLVDFLFSSGSKPPMNECDVDCNCLVDPIDLAYMVDYLFGDQALPGCGP